MIVENRIITHYYGYSDIKLYNPVKILDPHFKRFNQYKSYRSVLDNVIVLLLSGIYKRRMF